MVYDDIAGTLDMGKRRVTDLAQNSKVYLPPPLNPTTEAGLAVKKQELMSTFKEFMGKSCDDRGNQKATSLNKSQREGLASLKKRSKEGELFILETDKTNKLAAVDLPQDGTKAYPQERGHQPARGRSHPGGSQRPCQHVDPDVGHGGCTWPWTQD